jgi:hypothetical protein
MLAPSPGETPYRSIIKASSTLALATSITLELKNLERRGNDGVWAAGNYSVIVKDKAIQGNWFRTLKGENGTWKIAMEAFGRVGVIDAPRSPCSDFFNTSVELSHITVSDLQ